MTAVKVFFIVTWNFAYGFGTSFSRFTNNFTEIGGADLKKITVFTNL